MPQVRSPTFNDLLRRHRRAARLTQEELAERAALSPRGLRYLEHGTRAPYPDTVRRLIAALQLPDAAAAELSAAARAHRDGAGHAPTPPPPQGDLIGREGELADARELLGRCRLLTVLGLGGVGKTRFAIEVASMVGAEFSDGVAWVPLAGVAAAEEVAPAILQALGGAGSSGHDEPEAVLARLHDARLLLVLDNFEHVAKAADLVSRLVAGCPAVDVLITSRAPLRIGAEQEFWLQPLPLPSAGDVAAAAIVQASPAVQLFERRARAVDRHFTVDDANAADVAELCRRLEGLPLALELAAPRLRVLTPRELVDQLANRLDLLAGGAFDAPARHRSVRSTLDWSYELLDPHSQRLFRTLSVFAGGCSLAAVRAVCAPSAKPSFNIVDAVDALRRNSLIQLVEPPRLEARYSMLETVREYGIERLHAAGEDHGFRRRHATYFADLAIETAPLLEGPGQPSAAAQLEDEHDNLRAALQWLIEFDVETAVRLAGQLWMFWYLRGYVGEGRRYLAAALEKAAVAPPRPARAKALLGAGQLARAQGDFAVARGLMEDAIDCYRELGDNVGLAHALFGTGFVARMQEDDGGAERYFDAALQLARDNNDDFGTGLTLHHLGLGAAELDGDLPRARALLEESLARFRSVGFPRHVALVLSTLGSIAGREGRLDDARRLHSEALILLLESGQQVDIHWVLEGFVELASAEADFEQSVRVAAAARTLRSRLGDPEWGPAERRRERLLSGAREALGESGYAAAWRSGENLSTDAAAALVLGDMSPQVV